MAFSILKRICVLIESFIVGKHFQVSSIADSEKGKKSKHNMLHSLSAMKPYRLGAGTKSSECASQQSLTDVKLTNSIRQVGLCKQNHFQYHDGLSQDAVFS